jgi:TonB family protein
MVVSVITFGQVKKESKDEIKEAKVSPPRFAGVVKSVSSSQKGQFESITDYMARNVEYPQKSVKSFEQGTVIVQFMVSATGEISDCKIINSVSNEIDEEVLRVLNTTEGMWIPGVNNDNPVAMENEVSVVFKISGEKYCDFDYLGKKYFTKGSEMLNIKHDPKKALKYYDKGIVLLPKDLNLLLMRGLARYEVGNKEGAFQDWNRIKTLGGIVGNGLLDTYSKMEGYTALISILKN